MKKEIVFLICVMFSFFSCQKEKVKMTEYSNTNKCITFNVPHYMSLVKEDAKSMLFDGNKRLLKVMWINMVDEGSWDLGKFAQRVIGDNASKLSLVESNDTLIAYEIQRGFVSIPAQEISIHQCNGYSILVCSFGIDKNTHDLISNSIKCKKAKPDKKDISNQSPTLKYNGDYIELEYPNQWVVDENINDQTADVYIGMPDKSFGARLFRFENENDIPFKDSMNEIADNWRNFASVDVEYVTINGNEWCKQFINTSVQGEEMQQVSYYCQKGTWIYNVKFGNCENGVNTNKEKIVSIMKSIKLK